VDRVRHIDDDVQALYGRNYIELQHLWAADAPCMLLKNGDTEQGEANGAMGTMSRLVYNDDETRQQVQALLAAGRGGKTIVVPRPDAVAVVLNGQDNETLVNIGRCDKGINVKRSVPGRAHGQLRLLSCDTRVCSYLPQGAGCNLGKGRTVYQRNRPKA
jgi:hypothetical protein